MSLTDLIVPTIPVLNLNDTGDNALRMMSEAHLDYLPLVENRQYVCLVKESDLLDWETPDLPLSDFPDTYFRPFCFEQLHPFDAVKVSIQQKLSIVPVLDKENNYLGSITRDELFYFLGDQGSLNEPGGILVLEVKPGDYSLSQIARLCESENVVIINSRVKTNATTGMLDVTLKTNKTELEALAATFERYDYIVKELHGELPFNEDLASRYQLLMSYINM